MSIRPAAVRRLVASGAPLLVVAACARRPTSPAAAATTVALLLPGSRALQPFTLRAGSQDVRVFVRRAADSAERVMSDMHRGERPHAGDAGRLDLTLHYDPPYVTHDTLVVRRDGLVPIEEILRTGGRTIRIRYDGRHITGTTQAADSAPQPFVVDAAEVPFAFNELEPIVRSLPMRRGARFVVPLFSEIDRAVEHDTLTVLGDSLGDSLGGAVRRRTWLVRFADPAIVSVYGVDAGTRAVVSQETSPRRGGHMRFVPLASLR